jgi:hypothetical protein
MKPIVTAVVATLLTGGLSHASTLYEDVNPNVDPNYPTQPVAAFLFGSATDISGDTITNILVNQLTLTPGSAGDQITSLSFLLYSDDTDVADTRLLLYVWAPDGTSGNPGTLLGQFIIAPPYIAGPGESTLTYNVITPLIVPASGIIWVGAALDNDNGASSITDAQLDNIGGLTFDPPTVGTAPLDASYISPGTALTDPSLNFLTGGSQGDFGWTVTGDQAPAPEPGTLGMMLLGVPAGVFVWRRRSYQRQGPIKTVG